MGNELKRGKLLKRAGLVILMGACAMLMSASQGWATIIDHFDSGFFYTVGSTPVGGGELEVFKGDPSVPIADQFFDSRLKTGLATVLGNQRLAELTYVSDGLGDTARSDVAPHVGEHYLAYNNPAGMRSILDLTYGGDNQLNADMTDCKMYVIRFTDIDQAAAMFVTVTSHLGEVGLEKTDVGLVHTAGAGDAEVDVPFSEFPDIDFTDVDTIKFTFTNASGDMAVDFKLDSVECAVPEPLTMLGMVFGLGSVGAYIRKRRMA